LVHRFTLVSLAGTVVFGLIFGAIAVRLVEGYALERQAFTTALYVSEFLARRLTPKDFYGDPSAKRVQYEFAMRGVVGKAQILRVTVWSSVGRVLYSDDRKLIGLAFPPSAPLRAALSGQVRSVIVHAKRRAPAPPSPAAGSSQTVSPQAAASSPAAASSRVVDARQIEVFVPVRVPGAERPVVGVYDILTNAADLEPALARLKLSVWSAMVVGIGALYLLLFAIVRTASKDLVDQEAELRKAFVGTVRSLVKAVDARDVATADHSDRVAARAVEIGREMGLGSRQVVDIWVAAFLHDLGKIGLGDDILAKPGPLTEKERRRMQRHPVVGYEILQPVPIRETIKLAVRHHHERWDGKGYPNGLAGNDIPVAARIIAVADTYEALVSDRPYRSARSPDEAITEVIRCSGSQFDPRVVDAFLTVAGAWKAAADHPAATASAQAAGDGWNAQR
jgi:HD-GYP domain-containing protein (c-di-GMP phosphodiesterase class II)